MHADPFEQFILENKKKEPAAPNAVVIDAGQFHGSVIPEHEQKHQIVRGKVSGTGWPIDGHTLVFEIEKGGNDYYLINWPDACDAAVMETMHTTDPLYQGMRFKKFKRLWKAGKWEPAGCFFLERDKVEVKEVVRTWDE